MGDMADWSMEQWPGEDEDESTWCDQVRVPYDSILLNRDKSWLIKIGRKEHRFPKSCCEVVETEKVIIAPTWLLVRKGLAFEEP